MCAVKKDNLKSAGVVNANRRCRSCNAVFDKINVFAHNHTVGAIVVNKGTVIARYYSVELICNGCDEFRSFNRCFKARSVLHIGRKVVSFEINPNAYNNRLHRLRFKICNSLG